jgi:hypothetical protein
MSPEALTPDHHDIAFATGDVACVHDAEREGCTGCAHDAALRAATPDPARQEAADPSGHPLVVKDGIGTCQTCGAVGAVEEAADTSGLRARIRNYDYDPRRDRALAAGATERPLDVPDGEWFSVDRRGPFRITFGGDPLNPTFRIESNDGAGGPHEEHTALAAGATERPLDVADLRARIETNLNVYQRRVDNGTATDFDAGKRAAFRVVLSMLGPRGEATFSCGRSPTATPEAGDA